MISLHDNNGEKKVEELTTTTTVVLPWIPRLSQNFEKLFEKQAIKLCLKAMQI